MDSGSLKFGVLAALMLFLLGTGPYDASYEAAPGATDPVSSGDDEIRDLKVELRLRTDPEVNWGATLSDDNGLNRVGSARGFVGNTAPDNLNDLEPSPGTWTDYDNSPGGTGQVGISDFNDGASQTSSTDIYDDVGHGRLWMDQDGADDASGTTQDNNALNVYVGEAGDDTPVTITDGWTLVHATPVTHGSEAHSASATKGSYNIIYNGGFSVTDGTGDVSSVLIPTGFVSVVGATYTYDAAPPTTEGDGVEFHVTASGTTAGVGQVLTNLKASTTYDVVVRGYATSGDTCTVNTINADTNMTDVDITATSSTTASGTFITAAALDSVTVQLLGAISGDICHWSSVAVYEQNTDSVSQPGITACYDTDSTDTDNYYVGTANTWTDSRLSCQVTVPGPGYIILVTGKVIAETDAGQASEMEGRMQEDCGGGATTVDWSREYGQDTTTSSGNENPGFFEFGFNYINILPTVGATCSYVMALNPLGAPTPVSYDSNFLNDSAADGLADVDGDPVSSLTVVLIPTR